MFRVVLLLVALFMACPCLVNAEMVDAYFNPNDTQASKERCIFKVDGGSANYHNMCPNPGQANHIIVHVRFKDVAHEDVERMPWFVGFEWEDVVAAYPEITEENCPCNIFAGGAIDMEPWTGGTEEAKEK